MARTQKAGPAIERVPANQEAGVFTLGKMQDRVWISFGLTLNMGNYESARVDVGMVTDLHEGETPEEGLARCKEVVSEEVESQVQQVRSAAGGPAVAKPKKSAKSKKRQY